MFVIVSPVNLVHVKYKYVILRSLGDVCHIFSHGLKIIYTYFVEGATFTHQYCSMVRKVGGWGCRMGKLQAPKAR